MPGYSPSLPLTSDPGDGILLNKTYTAVAKQNLKMLLLTIPGERIMDPEFGIGLPTFFFENISLSTFNKIEERINQQTERYLPYIILNKISINDDQKKLQDENVISIMIEYSIKNIGVNDKLDLQLEVDSVSF